MEKAFPMDDTPYLADDLRMWFAGRASGVLALENCLSISPTGGMAIKLSQGIAYVKAGSDNLGGAMYGNDQDIIFDLTPADSALSRIDALMVRYDKVANSVVAMIVEGVTASSPKVPTVTRTATCYDIMIGYVTINKGISEITASMIADTRGDSKVCGLIRDNIERIPTDVFQSSFNDWFERIKGQLSEDAAGHLQNQIDEFANEDLLINSDFRNPINQRSQSTYQGNNTKHIYAIDRFFLSKSAQIKLSVLDNCVQIINSSDKPQFISQVIENKKQAELYPFTATVKQAEQSSTYIHTFFKPESYKINDMLSVELRKVDDYLIFIIVIAANGTVNLEWCKLEPGSKATPYIKQQRAIEIQCCQRFYQVHQSRQCINLSGSGTTYQGFGFYNLMRQPITYDVESLQTTSGVEQKSRLSSLSLRDNGVAWFSLSAGTQFSALAITLRLDGEIYVDMEV